jgi:4-amino-4-deoxy-L-arabinose transferase-like glycosyltransferase
MFRKYVRGYDEETVIPIAERAPRSLQIDGVDRSITTKAQYSFFALGLLIFIGTRLWHLTDNGLWSDEIFSIYGVRQDWGALINYIIEDLVHPPLFYLLLKIWTGIGGESLYWLRILPVLISTATLIPFFLLCRELKLRAFEINFALVLMSLNGYLIYYAQEVRMYSLLQFFAISSIWIFVTFLNSEPAKKRHLLALTTVNLLMVYTHYFGWVVVGVELVFLLIWDRKRFRAGAACAALLAICFSPWVYVVWGAAKKKGGVHGNISWIPRPGPGSVINFYGILNGSHAFHWTNYLGLALFGFPIALWAWGAFRRARRREEMHDIIFWLLIAFAFLPTATIFISSRILPESIWVHRYMIIVAIPYLILVAAAAYRLRQRWFRTAALVCLLTWAMLSGFKQLGANSNAWDGSAMGSRIAWEPLMRQLIQAEPSSGDVYIFALETSTDGIKIGYYNVIMPIGYYSESVHERKFHIMNVLSMDDLQCQSTLLKGNKFWLAVFHVLQKNEYLRLLRSDLYDVGQIIEVPGAYGKGLSLISVSRR